MDLVEKLIEETKVKKEESEQRAIVLSLTNMNEVTHPSRVCRKIQPRFDPIVSASSSFFGIVESSSASRDLPRIS